MHNLQAKPLGVNSGSDFVQIQGRKNDPRATKVCARRLEQSAGRQRDRNGQGGETWGRKKTLGRKSEVGSKDLILVNSFATDSMSGPSVGFRQNGCSTPRISAPPPLELFLPPLEGWSKKLNSSSLPGQFRSTFSTQPSLAISNKLACQQRAGSIYSFRCHPRNNVF